MFRSLKTTIEKDPDWKAVVLALIEYRVGTEQCFSSGELARELRLYRPDLVFGVAALGSFVRHQHDAGALSSYEDGFDAVYPVTVSRTTTGMGRTPSGVQVLVYGKTASDAQKHKFEVDIPPPGGTLHAWGG